jgi:hypothetical protein
MIIAAIIIGIILLFFVCLALYLSDRYGSEFDEGVTLGMIIVLLILLEGIFIICINYDPEPTAMDVYQNKTTLEYKVVDDVKVDSVVIFKEEFKK